MIMETLALDIGGANLKVAIDDNGTVKEFSHYFPFWKRKDEFEIFLKDKIKRALPADKVRVTMTAELADCYETKGDGVRHILTSVKRVVPNSEVLSVEGELLSVEEALSRPCSIASANWLATSLWLAKEFKTGILIDTGSTTTDIIPVKEGKVIAKGKSDLERLQNSELVYSGILRTNVAAIVDEILVDGSPTPVSSELFSITADIYGILGEISNGEYSCETPDGKGKSVKDCMRRLARVVCSDMDEVDENQIIEIANYIREKQIEKISDYISKISERTGIENAFVCGSGALIAEKAARKAGIKAQEVDISPARALLNIF